jgi:mRNA-degrading endonuclease RelE of RelBE toxin-antitoxin system
MPVSIAHTESREALRITSFGRATSHETVILFEKVADQTSAGRELAEVGSRSDRERLAGYADRYRVRQGNYRLIYLVDDQASVDAIYKIGHRKDVYR